MKRWYVVYTRPQAEVRAEWHLKNQGYTVYLPRYRRTIRHARKVEAILRPLFSRYLFVAIDLENDRWRSIMGTVGVISLYCQNEMPLAVPDGLIESIKSRESDNGAVILAPRSFTKGEPLRVEVGAFADHTGLFEQMADNDRVILLFNLMGRQVRVRTPISALAAAS